MRTEDKEMIKETIVFLSKEQIARLCDEVPFPKLADGPDIDAAFDPFEYDGQELYYYYYSASETWGIGCAVPVARRPGWNPDGERDPLTSPEDEDIIDGIAFLPSPKLPPERGEALVRGPFRYRDRTLCWFYDTASEKWTLGLTIEDPEASRSTPRHSLVHLMN